MKPITIHVVVNTPIETVWDCWVNPDHITQWAFASDDWEAPAAENDVRVGGTFKTVMAAKDGSARFDFGGVYTAVDQHKHIAYTIGDGRTVTVDFETTPNGTKVTETFDPEHENSEDRQRSGWQAILDNFKKHVESHA